MRQKLGRLSLVIVPVLSWLGVAAALAVVFPRVDTHTTGSVGPHDCNPMMVWSRQSPDCFFTDVQSPFLVNWLMWAVSLALMLLLVVGFVAFVIWVLAMLFGIFKE